MTAAEVKAQLHALLHDVENGDVIEVTREGLVVATISPARIGKALMGRHAGVVTSNVTDGRLFSTGESWNAQ
jgi:antitoxin (DNA-binding transcriptional repressor) of toxin-antitoxin stability system